MTADHLDPPLRTDPAEDSTPDRAAEIADVYAWAAGGNLNVAVTFAGPAPVSQAGTTTAKCFISSSSPTTAMH